MLYKELYALSMFLNENFLKLLVHNNRLDLLPTISKLFEAYKAEDEGYVEVDVYTAFAFSKEIKQDFTITLEKTLGKKIHMNVAVDKSLIGGILVRAGDRVIDGSIKGRLQHMQKLLQPLRTLGFSPAFSLTHGRHAHQHGHGQQNDHTAHQSKQATEQTV